MVYGQKGTWKARKAWQLAENDECGNNDAKKIRQLRYQCRSLSVLLRELPSRDSGSVMGEPPGWA